MLDKATQEVHSRGVLPGEAVGALEAGWSHWFVADCGH